MSVINPTFDGLSIVADGGSTVPFTPGVVNLSVTMGAGDPQPGTPPVTSPPAFPTFNLQNNVLVVEGGTGQGSWANYDTVQFRGPNNITTSAPYVTRTMEFVLSSPMGGASNSPQAWCSVFSFVDNTLVPSSQAGVVRCMEIDMSVAGPDDYAGPVTGRAMVSIVGDMTAGYGGTDTVITNAIEIGQSGGSNGSFRFKNMIHLGAYFDGAAIDISTATAENGAPAIQLAAGQLIALGEGRYIRSDIGTNSFVISSGGVDIIHANETGVSISTELLVSGNVGFFGARGASRQTVNGSWSGGTAGPALAAALAELGLITNNTTA